MVRYFLFFMLSFISVSAMAQNVLPDEETILNQLYSDVERLGDLKSVVDEPALKKSKLEADEREKKRIKVANYTAMCNKGFGITCAFLAHSYRSGSLTPINNARALTLYQKACDAGYLYACGNAADMLQRGLGGRVDTLLAMNLFEKACNGDIGEACFFRAKFYYDETSPEYSPQNGLTFIQKACDLEYWIGCGQIGYVYYREIGVVRDIKKAIQFMEIACENNVLFSCDNLGEIAASGTFVPPNLNRAERYLKKACEHGNDVSCSGLGMVLYQQNNDNIEEAISLLEKGCSTSQEGLKRGCGFLAFLKVSHTGSKLKNVENLFRLACFENADGFACGNGARSLSGFSENRRDEFASLAKELAEHGCFLGDGFSCYHIGGAHLDGSWLNIDERRAAEYFDRACEAEYSKGCSELADMYAYKEIPSDDSETISQIYYRKACRNGDKYACASILP